MPPSSNYLKTAAMLGMSEVLEGSFPLGSMVADPLQRGQWSPSDVLSSLHHCLHAFAVHSSSAALPHCDTAVSFKTKAEDQPGLGKGSFPSRNLGVAHLHC